ncbi:MAG: hypothetical protein IT158_24280 [Bryobacterales bacterium]|nr:hypothetical protein [Bryobacterales bacterium]
MKRTLIVSWGAALLFAAGYLAYVALQRSPSVRKPPPAAKPAAPAGTALRIVQFYPNRFEVARGESALLCYGVENARSVRLEPPVEPLRLSPNRCISVTPERTTTYTLIAEGNDNTTQSEKLTVKVAPPGPSILFVELNSKELRRGEPLVLCYGVSNASAVRLDPVKMTLRPSERYCVKLFPVRTTEYTLTAAGQGNRTDSEKFTITVR